MPSSDPPKSWYDSGLSFTCTQCGNCCTGPSGYVWFEPDEAKAMADYLKLSLTEFHRRFCRREYGRWTLEEVKRDHGYDCVFLRRDDQGKGLCSIYPVRPTQCRTWPFWESNLESPDAWRLAAQRCPGMAKGGTQGDGNFYPVEKIRILVERNPEGL